MKILFIYPNLDSQIGFNYGISIISSLLKKEGHKTKLINLNEKLGFDLDLNYIKREILSYQPDLIGFSVVTNQYKFAKEIADSIRKYWKSPVVCGGVHATMDPEGVLKDGLFDYACVGEGEDALLDLVHYLEKGKKATDIPNIWTKENGYIIKNPVRPFIDLTRLPLKDYELFDFQRMIDAKNGWVGLMVSRGCPFKCSYCFNHRIVEIYKNDLKVPANKLKYIRFHPHEQVFKEIGYLLERYKNIKTFIFDDDLFTYNRKYIEKFLSEYKIKVKVPFVVNGHVMVFDDKIASLLKDAGCIIVKFGLESGSERIRRDVLRRYMSNKKIEEAFRSADKKGIHTSAFVMIGIPKETKEDLFATIDLIARIKPGRFRWSIFFPYKGTYAYTISEREGLIDYKKMFNLPNFTDESCLDFGEEHNLLIDKLAHIFPWYVNMRAGFPASFIYEKRVKEIEQMGREKWDSFKKEVLYIDEELSKKALAIGSHHYAIKYNRFTAVKDDWYLGEQEN